jgi:hypothetical protein
MAELILQNVPEELMHRIERVAESRRLPVPEAAVQLLQQAVAETPVVQEKPRTEVLEILDRMWRNSITPGPDTPDSLEMLREDRAR